MSKTEIYPPPPNSRRISMFKKFNRINILWVKISLKLFQLNGPLQLAEVFFVTLGTISNMDIALSKVGSA